MSPWALRLLALSALVAAPTALSGEVEQRRCSWGSVSECFQKDDGGSEAEDAAREASPPALGLVQRALRYKVREAQLAVSVANATQTELGEVDSRHAFQSSVAACLHDSTALPFAVRQRAELTVFNELGLTEKVPRCRPSSLMQQTVILKDHTVAEKNRIANYITVSWMILASIWVLWSAIAVMTVPGKQGRAKATAKEINVADEDAAWNYGLMYWLSLSWADDIMGRYGKHWGHVIDEHEITWTYNQDSSQQTPFKKHWQEQVELRGMEEASIPYALFKTVGWKASIILVCSCLLEITLSMVGMVIAMERVLMRLDAMHSRQMANPDEPLSYLEPTLEIIGFVFIIPMGYRTCSILCSLLDGYYTNVCASGLAMIVFDKALELPAGASPPKPVDEDEDPHKNMDPHLVQLLNVDIVEAWAYLLKALVYTSLSPIMVIVLAIMMIQRIHMAGFVGFLYCVPVMCLECAGTPINIGYWMQYQGFMDRRLKFLTETILHIRTIKSLALETLAFDKLNKARTAELAFLQKAAVCTSVLQAIGSTIPWGTVLSATYYLLVTEGSVAAWKILIIQRLMGSLLSAVSMFTGGLGRYVSVPNNFTRIKKYLCKQQRPRDVMKDPTQSAGQKEVEYRLKGNFTFLENLPTALQDLDVTIHKGEAVAVIGAVGSGKSALLQTMLGELFPLNGATAEGPLQEECRVAYCSQVPWIAEGTLRENVLAGKEMDEDRYYEALYAASLTSDLEILPGGDQVCIGSYGVRLSGGQRSRVSLARAAFMRNTDVAIIDDPFASVDMPTGQQICDALIFGKPMEDRTRIVAMQPTPGRLQKFDRVLLLEKGRVVEQGTPATVLATEAFARLQSSVQKGLAPTKSMHGKDTWKLGAQAVATVVQCKADQDTAQALREAEGQDHITMSTIRWWLNAAGWHNLLYFAAVLGASRWLGLWQSVTLATWVDAKMRGENNDLLYMSEILWRTGLQSLCVIFTMHAATRVSLTAAKKLHEKVIKRIVRAPTDTFHDKQPTGRLITRLSYDMRQVDDTMPFMLSQIFGFFAGFFVTESFILKIMPWQYILAALPFFGVCFFFTFVYRNTTVPLVFHSKFGMSELADLQAVVLTCNISIRTNGRLGHCVEMYKHKALQITRCQYLIYHVCTGWVQSRIFLIFSVLTTLFAVGGLRGGLPMGTLSMIISLSMSQMMEFEGLAMLFTQSLNTLNALQRVTRYFDIPQEGPQEMEGDPQVRLSVKVEGHELEMLELREGPDAELCPQTFTLCLKGNGRQAVLVESDDGRCLQLVRGCKLADLCPALEHIEGSFAIVSVNHYSKDARKMSEELCNPPSKIWLELWNTKYVSGISVEFQDVSAGYGNDKSVLHNVNFLIEPRMKAGFAGKTGCGKSTTLLCILRLLEARSGQVFLGDMDAAKMGLRALRTIVGLVPQDATIFEGTWRKNIDPFDEYPDGRVWQALRCAHLISHIRSLDRGLESLITREGTNLSFGQKQLLSMARMVIRQPPVLLLDECTSSLDPVTQDTVQTTILNEFPMSTVIAIAHRVETIIEFDRIVVFDQGTVAEDGSASKILAIPNGIFKTMVEASRH